MILNWWLTVLSTHCEHGLICTCFCLVLCCFSPILNYVPRESESTKEKKFNRCLWSFDDILGHNGWSHTFIPQFTRNIKWWWWNMYRDIVHIRIGLYTSAVALDAILGHTLTTACHTLCTADGGWGFYITLLWTYQTCDTYKKVCTSVLHKHCFWQRNV